MSNNYLKVIRAGIKKTLQEKNRNNLKHNGIQVSGGSDNRNKLKAKKLVGNKLDRGTIK